MIHVIAERSIPYLDGLNIEGVRLTRLENHDFSPQSIRGASALIVRSITRCTEALLSGSAVRLICTATAGVDHIDLDYCARHGIAIRSAAGCNATAVAQWLYSALSTWSQAVGEDLRGKIIGIIGVGHVGQQVLSRCSAFGLKPLLYDPPRAEVEGEAGFATLQQIQREADIITLHTPLTLGGAHPTYHLVDRDFIAVCARKPLIVNACRGGVTDTDALLWGMDAGLISAAALDCWEGEPHPRAELLSRALIATPHIAGFSADGKLRGAHMSVEALCSYFGLPLPSGLHSTAALEPPPTSLALEGAGEETLRRAMLQTLDLGSLTCALKTAPQDFEPLRRAYHYPREMAAYTFVPIQNQEVNTALRTLGFTQHQD